MSLEQNLLLLSWIIGLLVVSFGVPYGRRHSFFVAFLTAQGLAWFAEIMLLQFNVVSYPIREFPKASNLGITLEIILVPLSSAIYVIYEPRKSWFIRTLYLAFWVGVVTASDFIIAHFSRLQDQKNVLWLVDVFVFSAELVATNATVRWFFRHSSLLQSDRRTV